VSSLVVVLVEMGSGIMDILQAWASTPSLEAPDRQASLQQEPAVGKFATDHSDKQTYDRSPRSIGEISAHEGKRVNFDGSLGLEGAGGLQWSDVKNSSVVHEDGDYGIMGFVLLFITLNTLLTTTAIQLNKK
nr:hypothetical protein [Tanacetum cinerariifolium]GFB15588.1 hypothetical protein [Tanacetum cinerariifolium]